MKKDIHPKMNELEVVLVSGEKIKVKTTYDKEKTMKLDVDPSTHPAWTGKRNTGLNSGQVDKFKKKFGGFM